MTAMTARLARLQPWGSWFVFGAMVVVASVMFVVVTHTLMSDTGLSDRQAIGLALVQGLALMLAPPLAPLAWACSMTAVVLASVWAGAGLWVDAMTNSYLIVLGAIAVSVPARHAVAYWAGTSAAGTLLAIVRRPDAWLSNLLEVMVLAAVVLVAGAALGGLAAARRRLRDEQAAVQRQRERTALLEERTRIARELHDVVAHHMSVIAIQAEAARYREPQSAPETFAAIRDSARTALGEMRRILGVLRSGDTGAAPQPTLTDVPRLIDSVRAAGTRVDLDTPGDVATVPAGIGLSAYRIVQEALSNAVRHAPGVPVRVRISLQDSDLHIDVRNCFPWEAGRGTGFGHGLAGMRERAELLGGTFTGGPTGDGHFRVAVTLPIRDV
ncbi:histidine kinase [Nocardia sp. CDC159]|uniref:histidine kinase n=1 Tax=Nocardia pulmonis TaxID=2951408 RepID=A0A9X2ECT8_9NOCA|nr:MULTISPECIES: histidine kinase [Nocardia]MCM6778397.1 histidine kinase [Nocardia pulmonis]MCM6791207.1 histidine kinase [Nocardia sp. CDC159]